MENKKNRDYTGIVYVVIGVAVIIFALWNIYSDDFERNKAQKKYEEMQEAYIETQPVEEKKKDWWSTDVRVEFDKLRQVNPDIQAWIRSDDPEATGLNYPILYSEDNDTYLRKDPYGKENIAGSIFIEEKNKPDFTDYYTIIYGHNMVDGSMFGKLKNYSDPAFYKEHMCFTIYTEKMAYRYQIFSCEDTVSDSDVYKMGYKPGSDYREFIARMLLDSDIPPKIVPKDQDFILTLSTCAETDSKERFAVHAVCVDKQQIKESYKE